MAAEAAFNLEELVLKKAPLLSATLRDFIAEGRSVGAVTYLQALKLRLALQDELERFLARYDAIITPPTTGEAPATLEQTGNPAFCSIWSLCGVPAVTIPVGFGPRGLPLGLQIVGSAGEGWPAPVRGPLVRRTVPLPLLEGKAMNLHRPSDETEPGKRTPPGRSDRRGQVRQHVPGPGQEHRGDPPRRHRRSGPGAGRRRAQADRLARRAGHGCLPPGCPGQRDHLHHR